MQLVTGGGEGGDLPRREREHCVTDAREADGEDVKMMQLQTELLLRSNQTQIYVEGRIRSFNFFRCRIKKLRAQFPLFPPLFWC